MNIFDGSVSLGTFIILGLCLFIALGFEFVNGFHDTANAVATVIYTKSLKPGVAVVWSGLMNLLGVFFGGTAVAFGVVHLLPVDLLLNIGQQAGILMVLSLLLSAIIWNIGTWYFGLPASSSHALIGSILGVGLASSLFSDKGFGSGVNWAKAQQTGMSLLLSPLIGFVLAGCLLLLLKAVVKSPKLYSEPDGDTPPPLWVRAILCLTCTGVSFLHGSNDGQKGVGLIMLILIGLLPAQYALNPEFQGAKVTTVLAAVQSSEMILQNKKDTTKIVTALEAVESKLTSATDIQKLSTNDRRELRAVLLRADDALGKYVKSKPVDVSPEDLKTLKDNDKTLEGIVDFVAPWVIYAVAISLGLGTTIGWKRIVVTVGEKIGKTHLTYAQGAAAELVAMCTIFMADYLGLPVSTTHVLSSGIAGTMAANRSGLQGSTVRNIALAWVLTLPVTILLSGSLFLLTAGGWMKKNPPPAIERPQREGQITTQHNFRLQKDWPRDI